MWTVYAATPAGAFAGQLTNARSRKFTWRLNDACEASFTIDGRDPQALLLNDLQADVIAMRDGVKLFRGRVSGMSDTLDTDRHDTTVPVFDYRRLLDRRTIWPTSTGVYAVTDQSTIAWDFINDSQALPGGAWGITRGLGVTTGVPRDRTYVRGKVVGEALTELGNVINGFDWEIDALLKFNIYYPSRGSLKDFVVRPGDTVSKLTRAVDPSGYANALRVSGKDTNSGGPTPVTREAADVAARLEGRFELQIGHQELTTDAALNEQADTDLAASEVVIPTWTATLRPDRWNGPPDLWIGDTCRLVVQSGRLDVDTTVRVNEITVSLDDEGNETVDVTFNRPKIDPRRRHRLISSRLESLERK